MKEIKIVGGGLAGCEAALQFAKRGWNVTLYEMRPMNTTPAHNTDFLAELVCSNSLKSKLSTTASGLLKEELRILDCELLKLAEKASVPAGNALAVDRDLFAEMVTEVVSSSANIKVIREECTQLSDDLTIIATGPLTSDKLLEKIQPFIGDDNLYFYDAIAPIVSAESIDYSKAYFKARYDKGEPDYLNCPFNKEEYLVFLKALRSGEKYIGKEFEQKAFQDDNLLKKLSFYENCIPIEELARRGDDALRFGVMKPVGLEMPTTDRRPYAAIQLRSENQEKTAFNLVGCQTMLTQSSQREVFRQIPGLEKVEFYRYGSIHRNTYINSPEILNSDLSFREKPNVFVAGQLSGVEGYMESIASGLLVSQIITENLVKLPEQTILGRLWQKLTTKQSGRFVPVNANFGLLPPLEVSIRDKQKKKQLLSDRSIEQMLDFVKNP